MYRLLPSDGMQSAVMRLHVVCPSVWFHTSWHTSKITAQPNSLGSLLSLTQHEPSGATENPQNGVEYGWGQMKLIKAAIFLAS